MYRARCGRLDGKVYTGLAQNSFRLEISGSDSFILITRTFCEKTIQSKNYTPIPN